jgi:hypothetical protein
MVGKELPKIARLDIREDSPVPNILQIVSYVVHHLLP